MAGIKIFGPNNILITDFTQNSTGFCTALTFGGACSPIPTTGANNTGPLYDPTWIAVDACGNAYITGQGSNVTDVLGMAPFRTPGSCLPGQPGPNPNPNPTPIVNGVTNAPWAAKTTFPVSFDPTSGRFFLLVGDFNQVANDDTFNVTFIGLEASKSTSPTAALSKKKGKKKPKKVERYALSPVTVTLQPGQHMTVPIPLTPAAKRYVASRRGKSIGVDLVATVKDQAGQVNKFERTGQVKIKAKKKGKKGKKR
jgi:hypothetical protein